MFRVLFSALLLGAAIATAAAAAPVSLDGGTQARLETGDRARVLVWIAAPSAADAGEAGVEADAVSVTIGEVRDDLMMRVFGLPAARLAETAPGDDLPRLARSYRYTPVLAMELTADEIERLARDPAVRRIETDELSRPILDQSIPLIGANVLHTAGNTGAGIGVAILDTGVDHEHPAFAGRITGSACFSSTSGGSTSLCPAGASSDTTTPGAGDNCEEYTDNTSGAEGCSHGTHVAGIAAGADFTDPGNPARTLRGVAPGANIIAVQVFSRFTNANQCGSATPCVLSYTSDQLAALEWLYANRASLNLASINMSLGGGKSTTACSSHSHNTVIGQLREAGVATVIASGNEGFADGVSSPGCVAPAITVGSTTKADALSGFSNSSPLVDVLAPGSSIRAAYPSVNDSGAGRAASLSGTSMAAPHVAGAIALLRAGHPAATIDAMENALEATGVPILNNSNNVSSPRIRVDLASAQLTAAPGGVLAGVLTVSPVTAFNAAGSGSDPADYGTRQYTLTNTSGSPVDWQASGSADWIGFSVSVSGDAASAAIDGPAATTASGTIPAGGSAVVTVSANPSGLAAGNYLGTITFTANGQSPGLQIAAALAIGATPPANDQFANAYRLLVPAITAPFSNVGAGKELDEPNHGNNAGGSSVWWLWRAPFSGTVRVETQNASFDTTLGVYRGSVVNQLTLVGTNDDVSYPSNTHSRVEFEASAGMHYYFAVDGFGGAAGTGELSITQLDAPENDNLANARSIGGESAYWYLSNQNATLEAGESQHGGAAGGASVWYAWRAPQDGPVTFTADGDMQVLLAAYDTAVHGATPIAQSASGEIEFTAVEDATYYIALDGANGAQGMMSFWWTLAQEPAHRLRASLLPNARAVSVGDTATVFATVINPASYGVHGTNCVVEPPANFNGAFQYRRTNPATNEPEGGTSPIVTLAPGASQSYLFSFRPGVAMNGVELMPVFRCDTIRAASEISGVNTATMTASSVQTADIVSIAATPTANGVLDVPLNGARAFSVAAVNIGAAQSVTITPGTGSATLPLTIDMCETNPTTGACLTGRTPTVTVSFAANETRTFTIFVRSTGEVAFTPSTNRVFAAFTNLGSATVGATSVAVRTTAP